jgi:hypothetical protein
MVIGWFFSKQANQMMRVAHKKVVLFLFMIIVSGSFSFSQEVNSDATTDSIPPKESTPVSEIIGKSAKDQITINKLRDGLISEEDLKVIGSNVDSLIKLYKQTYTNSSFSEVDYDPSLHQIEKEKRIWVQVERKIKNTESLLVNRLNLQTDHNKKVTGLLVEWKKTQSDIKEDEVYSVLNERVTKLLQLGDSVKNEIGTQISFLLEKQTLLVEYSLQTNDQLNQIIDLMNNRNVSNLKINHEPLWKLKKHEGDTIGLFGQMSFVITDEIGPLKSYVQDFKKEVRFYVITFVILLIIFYSIHFKLSRKQNDQNELKDYYDLIRVFKHPIALALMVSSYTTLFIFISAPPLFIELIVLQILAGLLFVIPCVFSKKFTQILYGVSILFVITRIIGMTFVQTTNVRLLLLIISILSALLFLYMIRRSGVIDTIVNNSLRSIAKIVVYVILILFVVSVLANVIGA